MSDSTYIGQRVSNIDVSPQFQPYSKVIIHIDDETEVVAGNNTGRTLELTNPFGNQKMANNILQSLVGFQYQPYTADEALLDPASEIGDAAQTSAVQGGIYSRSRSFGRLMKADVAAPTDEEINHEYAFETPAEREYKRQVADVRASFILTNNLIQTEVERASEAEGNLKSTIEQTASEINATVSAETVRATNAENTKLNHTNTNQSFGWSLTASAFLLKNNNQTVFQFDANGLRFKSNGADVFTVTRTGGLYVKGNGEFTGKVTASSGKIGGFDIEATALSYNGLAWGDTSKNYGVYIGQSGIQLGKNFSVDNSGSIRASSLTLQGNITFLDDSGTVAGTLSAADLRQGAIDGYTWMNDTYGSTGMSYGAYALGGGGAGYSAQATWDAATNPLTGIGNFRAGWIYAGSMTLGGYGLSLKTAVIDGTAISFVGWGY